MTKRLLICLLITLLCLTAAQATILPASGVDEDFRSWTGIEAIPAVILCQSLSVLDARGDQGGRVVETLYYTGTGAIPVIESWDGYAKISYADGTKTGWVRNDYLLLDPAWYLCDASTQVYAYPDVMSPRVALLDAGTKLPILTEYRDEQSIGGWVCVSLRGAAGWIRMTPKDTVKETAFRPEQLEELGGARLDMNGESFYLGDASALQALAAMLTSVEDRGGTMAGCPFGATLMLETESGQMITLELATDSCCIYRVDGRDYAYARSMWSPEEGSPGNEVLFRMFGVDARMMYR